MFVPLELFADHGMITEFSFFVFAPLTILACWFSLATALLVLSGNPNARRALRWGTYTVFTLWMSGALCAIASRITYPNWTHTFWAAQIPMVGLFLGSGVLLCRTWSDDAAFLSGLGQEAAVPGSPGQSRAPSPALVFLGMMLCFGLGVLALQWLVPDPRPSQYATGQPLRNLVELAAWGFGGLLPGYLEPHHQAEVSRGVGHLPREVTVPMGSTMIAAWLWIAFSALALLGRLILHQRIRIGFYLSAPTGIGILVLWWLASGVGYQPEFDPRFFTPIGSLESGIWKSEPDTMKSYGPLILAAATSALLLGLALLKRSNVVARG